MRFSELMNECDCMLQFLPANIRMLQFLPANIPTVSSRQHSIILNNHQLPTVHIYY